MTQKHHNMTYDKDQIERNMTLCHTQIHHTDIKKRTNDSIVLKNIFGTQFVLIRQKRTIKLRHKLNNKLKSK